MEKTKERQNLKQTEQGSKLITTKQKTKQDENTKLSKLNPLNY